MTEHQNEWGTKKNRGLQWALLLKQGFFLSKTTVNDILDFYGCLLSWIPHQITSLRVKERCWAPYQQSMKIQPNSKS